MNSWAWLLRYIGRSGASKGLGGWGEWFRVLGSRRRLFDETGWMEW